MKFQSITALREAVDAYFVMCDDEKRPYTIAGLAHALDTTRNTLLRMQAGDYIIKNEDEQAFVNTINRAKSRCLVRTEERALTGVYNSGISQFILKNNFGYKDLQTHEIQRGKRESTAYDLMEEEELLRIERAESDKQ